MTTLDAKVPEGPIQEKWTNHRFDSKLVNPANKRKYEIIIIGTGLAGASAAASLGELGYKVTVFTYHDSPRRAHSIAAQGGINAAKNYTNDGDSIYRLFYDTVKGGDYRSREANVYRLAEVSNEIIDQCTAQGVPFAREYGGVRSTPGARPVNNCCWAPIRLWRARSRLAMSSCTTGPRCSTSWFTTVAPLAWLCATWSTAR